MLPHNISDGGLSAVEWVNSFIHRFLRQIGPGMQPGRAGLLELVVHLTVIRRKDGSSHSLRGMISHFLRDFPLCRTTACCVVAGCNIIDSMRPGTLLMHWISRRPHHQWFVGCSGEVRRLASGHSVTTLSRVLMWSALSRLCGATVAPLLPMACRPHGMRRQRSCVSSLQAENDVTPVSESSRQHVSAGRMSTAAVHGGRAEARANEASLSWAWRILRFAAA